MGFGDTSPLCKIVLILLILCFIIDLIGFAIPFWYLWKTTDFKIYSGLWTLCVESNTIKECGNIEAGGLTDWFRAVQAFSTLSWLFFLAALALVFAFMFCMSNKKVLYLVAVCLSFAGAFCSLIAFAVFAGETNKELKGKLNAAFGLTIVAFILGLITGVLGIVDYLQVVGGTMT